MGNFCRRKNGSKIRRKKLGNASKIRNKKREIENKKCKNLKISQRLK